MTNRIQTADEAILAALARIERKVDAAMGRGAERIATATPTDFQRKVIGDLTALCAERFISRKARDKAVGILHEPCDHEWTDPCYECQCQKCGVYRDPNYSTPWERLSSQPVAPPEQCDWKRPDLHQSGVAWLCQLAKGHEGDHRWHDQPVAPTSATGEPTSNPCELPEAQRDGSRPRHFVCEECGPHAAVDEDGCCTSCGVDATEGTCDEACPPHDPKEAVRAYERVGAELNTAYAGLSLARRHAATWKALAKRLRGERRVAYAGWGDAIKRWASSVSAAPPQDVTAAVEAERERCEFWAWRVREATTDKGTARIIAEHIRGGTPDPTKPVPEAAPVPDTIDAESFADLVERVKNPRAPTQALRDLMAAPTSGEGDDVDERPDWQPPQEPGESDADYATRVWREWADRSGLNDPSVLPTTEAKVDAAMGRGASIESAEATCARLNFPALTEKQKERNMAHNLRGYIPRLPMSQPAAPTSGAGEARLETILERAQRACDRIGAANVLSKEQALENAASFIVSGGIGDDPPPVSQRDGVDILDHFDQVYRLTRHAATWKALAKRYRAEREWAVDEQGAYFRMYQSAQKEIANLKRAAAPQDVTAAVAAMRSFSNLHDPLAAQPAKVGEHDDLPTADEIETFKDASYAEDDAAPEAAPVPDAPTCKPWCGTACTGCDRTDPEHMLCSPACRAAGRALRPRGESGGET